LPCTSAAATWSSTRPWNQGARRESEGTITAGGGSPLLRMKLPRALNRRAAIGFNLPRGSRGKFRYLSLQDLRGRTSTQATDPMMIQTHSFREQPAIVRTMIAFVAIAIVLWWFVGAVGILYALGLGALLLLIYLLTTAFAALLDPDVY
jgi:hypothetical protein